jgi:hypothetical protein
MGVDQIRDFLQDLSGDGRSLALVGGAAGLAATVWYVVIPLVKKLGAVAVSYQLHIMVGLAMFSGGVGGCYQGQNEVSVYDKQIKAWTDTYQHTNRTISDSYSYRNSRDEKTATTEIKYPAMPTLSGPLSLERPIVYSPMVIMGLGLVIASAIRWVVADSMRLAVFKEAGKEMVASARDHVDA